MANLRIKGDLTAAVERAAKVNRRTAHAPLPGNAASSVSAPRKRHLHYAGERLTANGRRTKVGLRPAPGTQAWAPVQDRSGLVTATKRDSFTNERPATDGHGGLGCALKCKACENA